MIMVSILYEMFMNIYSIYIYIYMCVCVFMKMFESMVTYVTKINLKESRLKYFTHVWYMGKG